VATRPPRIGHRTACDLSLPPSSTPHHLGCLVVVSRGGRANWPPPRLLRAHWSVPAAALSSSRCFIFIGLLFLIGGAGPPFFSFLRARLGLDAGRRRRFFRQPPGWVLCFWIRGAVHRVRVLPGPAGWVLLFCYLSLRFLQLAS
jgi:hypothetical protein